MTAVVVPFPSIRRRTQIRKTAAYIASATPGVAESHLREQLRRLEGRLLKVGIAPDIIASEVASYEGAIRAEIWRQVLSPGGAA